ncbi:MAG: hypothetical protein OHK0052_27560 [Anaerolineales bacterium]
MLTDTLTIRLCTRTDLPALEWDGELIHFRNLFAAAYEQMTLGRANIWLIGTRIQPIAGQAIVQMNGHRADLADGKQRAYLYGFRVRAAFRNHGLGTYLIARIESDLRQRNFAYLTLNVAKDNPDALRLYRRLGYRVIGEEDGHWWYFDHENRRREVYEPAWHMEKTL